MSSGHQQGRGSDFTGRLAAESERYLALLEKLGAKLSTTLDIEVTDKGTPNRDWARSFGHYSTGMRGLIAEQRERQKLALLAGKRDALSDEQYQLELEQLGLETLAKLPEDTLSAELEKRGIKVVIPAEADE